MLKYNGKSGIVFNIDVTNIVRIVHAASWRFNILCTLFKILYHNPLYNWRKFYRCIGRAYERGFSRYIGGPGPGETKRARIFLKDPIALAGAIGVLFIFFVYKGNNKITEPRTILQRESQNS
jgi:hypothetical protein